MYFLTESKELLIAKTKNKCLFCSFDIAGFEEM